MSVFLIKDILSDLEKMGFIHEMFSEKNADIQYHVAYNPTSITINQFMKEFDTKNIEYYSDVFSHLNDEDKRILEDIREKLSMKNMEEGEVKSIAELYANKEYTNPKKLNPNNQLEFEVVPNVENFIEEEENSKEKNKEKIEIVEEEIVQEEKNKENIIKEKENKENEEQKEKLKVEEKSEILESEESSQELNDTVEKMETKEAEKEIKVIEKEEEPISKKTEEKEIKDEEKKYVVDYSGSYIMPGIINISSSNMEKKETLSPSIGSSVNKLREIEYAYASSGVTTVYHSLYLTEKKIKNMDEEKAKTIELINNIKKYDLHPSSIIDNKTHLKFQIKSIKTKG